MRWDWDLNPLVNRRFARCSNPTGPIRRSRWRAHATRCSPCCSRQNAVGLGFEPRSLTGVRSLIQIPAITTAHVHRRRADETARLGSLRMRWDWDLNPGFREETCFQGRRVRPLRHPTFARYFQTGYLRVVALGQSTTSSRTPSVSSTRSPRSKTNVVVCSGTTRSEATRERSIGTNVARSAPVSTTGSIGM